MSVRPGIVAILAAAFLTAGAARGEVSKEVYARAEQMLDWNATERVFNAPVDPNWIDENRFWYLKGRLLLTYGTLDDNVHPNATLLLVNALIEHNKDFDMLVLPNRNHRYWKEPYVIRKTWDYFVKHLAGEEPPTGYEIQAPP